jgi:hypothetical protein
VAELHFDLKATRCPRCAGDLVLRVEVDERGAEVQLSVDTACTACGDAPWPESDERLLLFRPGQPRAEPASGEEPDARLLAAQARIEQLVRAREGLARDLEAARRDARRAADDARRRQPEQLLALRAELSRLEGELADARAQLRRGEEATRGSVQPGKRAIEIE